MDQYIALVESLLEPYFVATSDETRRKRKLDMKKVIEAAVEHGMMVIGLSHDRIEYRWGERSDRDVVVNPGVYMLDFERPKLRLCKEIVGPAKYWIGWG